MFILARIAAACLAFTALTAPIRAESTDSSAPAKMVVDFRATDRAPQWLARAFEGHSIRELAGFGRVTVVDRADISLPCRDFDVRCLLDDYRSAGIDVVLLGKVSRGGAKLSAHETWTARTLARDELSFGATRTLPEVRHRLITLLNPLFSSGGWLDQRPSLARLRSPKPPMLPTRGSVRTASLFVFCLFAFPLVLAWPWTRRRHDVVFRRLPTRWMIPAAVCAIAALAFAASYSELSASFLESPSAGRAAAIGGGLAWGTFVWLNFQVAVPRILGIERADYHALGPLLFAWTVSIGLRLVPLTLLYAPFVLIGGVVFDATALTDESTLFVVLPVAGLLILCFAAACIDAASLILDALLVQGAATPGNIWHQSAMRYLRGYVKRSGLSLPSSLLDEVVVLPTTRSHMCSYGGGLTHPRILVPLEVLEFALGEAPEDDNASSRRYFDVRHRRAGLVLPEVHSTANEDAELVSESALVHGHSNVLGFPNQDRLIGMNATLLGLVTPTDFERVRTTEGASAVDLADHYAGFLPLEWNEEQDDTNPNQHDLLFGALLKELGSAIRNDTVWQTLGLLFEQVFTWTPVALRRFFGGATRLFSGAGARPLGRIADAYPALNSGRDALIQYLYFRMTGDTEVLTARADSYRFASTSREIFRRTASISSESLSPVALDFRTRLLDLNVYLRTTITVAERRWPRRIFAGALVVCICGVIGYAVLDAARYSRVFEDRIEQFEAASAGREGRNGGTN